MKKRPPVDAEVIAKAEKILNRTLAYQAAIAVHELKEVLGLDVEELSLVVAPVSIETPDAYRVICTIAHLATPAPVVLDVVIQPDKAMVPTDRKAAD